jgi:hypothetical protein
LLGDLLTSAGFNVTSITDPQAIERFHFLAENVPPRC